MRHRKGSTVTSQKFGSHAVKTVSMLVLTVFIMNFCLVPCGLSLTVKEAAGDSKKSQPRYYDEFNNKAAERRDKRTPYGEKDPRLACMLSLIVPGGGHVYLREDFKGISFCLLTGAGYAASGYYLYLSLFGDGSSNDRKSNTVISGLLFMVAAIIHVVGVVEAYNDAVEINEKKFYYGIKSSDSPFIATIEKRKLSKNIEKK